MTTASDLQPVAGPCRANHWRYLAALTSLREAREHTRNFLRHCRESTPDLISTAELLVSELVANACTASPATEHVGLSLRCYDHQLLVEVVDSSPDPPVLLDSDLESERGRGLLLVDELSSDWGYFYLGDGRKSVYAILPIPVGAPCG